MYRVSAAAAVPAVGTTTGDRECVWSVGGLKLGVAATKTPESVVGAVLGLFLGGGKSPEG